MYTFLMEFRGGTYINQVYSESLAKSLDLWIKQLDYREIKFFGPGSIHELEEALQQITPIQIIDVDNVWFFSKKLKAGQICVNIVKTQLPKK